MAQVSMTVKMDSQLKQTFDELCKEFGMSVNTAFNIFANAVVKTRSIPFEIKSHSQNVARKESDVYQRGNQAFREIRAMAEAGQLPDLTLDEINEEIRLAREERAARVKAVV